MQNDAIADKLSSLMKQREEVLHEQTKHAVIIDEKEETIKSIMKLLGTETSAWTNEMMKKVVNRINLDRHNDEIEIVYNFSLSN